jgi:hypothetical protein
MTWRSAMALATAALQVMATGLAAHIFDLASKSRHPRPLSPIRAKQPLEARCSMILQPYGNFGVRWYGLHHLAHRFYFTKRPVYH